MRKIVLYLIMIFCCKCQFGNCQTIGVGLNFSQAIYRADIPDQANFFFPSLGFSFGYNYKINGNHFLITGLDLLNFNTGMRTNRDFGNGAKAYVMTRPRTSVFQVPIGYEFRLKSLSNEKKVQKFIRSGIDFQTLKTSGYAARTSLQSPNTPNINGTGRPYSASARVLASTTDNRIFNINPFLGIGGYYKLNKTNFAEISVNSTFIRNVPFFSAFHYVNNEINSIDTPNSTFLITLKLNYYLK